MTAEKTPIIAHRKGFYYEIKAGQRYLWCACGRSNSQPFCDGSHAGTGFLPVAFKAERDEDVIFCGCKHTGTRPFCDGTHSNLPGGYRTDDPNSPENRQVATVAASAAPTVRLDGACYLFSTSRATLSSRGRLRYCPVVSPALGALFQSQFYAEVAAGSSPVISAEGRHTVLFIAEGHGEIEISGRRFAAAPLSGIYVRPSEAYRVHNDSGSPLKFYISNGPGSEDLVWLDEMPSAFEEQYPERCATIDPSQRHKIAERYYQLLVNREHGSTVVTQFIGNIPLSKAEPHQHLYEEALILFLPRKQVHSVECTTPGGFDVVGIIYPGDNPSISY
jgi:CDGSH-type Zn-finger protein